MRKLLLINVSVNSGSTGRIVEAIGQTANQKGYESYVAYGRAGRESSSHLIRIGNRFTVYEHVLETRLFDNHGFSSRIATKAFINKIERIKPDIINLHNLHGYYINVKMCFDYLSTINVPIVWTLHDCWAFTGHCAGFDSVNCLKWKDLCYDCPLTHAYPKSLIIDRSRQNYLKKMELFTMPKNMTIVTPSSWLKEMVDQSFLQKREGKMIHNGVDLDIFKPLIDKSTVLNECEIGEKKVILGVANIWSRQKGLDDFIKLSLLLDRDKYQIILVGVNDKVKRLLPNTILSFFRTENVHQLALLYSRADVFVNPTYVDNFPTTNIEALACGTPVITYNTGGSPEAIDSETGIVVSKGDIQGLKEAIELICNQDRLSLSNTCRQRAELLFNKNNCFNKYISLFNSLL